MPEQQFNNNRLGHDPRSGCGLNIDCNLQEKKDQADIHAIHSAQIHIDGLLVWNITLLRQKLPPLDVLFRAVLLVRLLHLNLLRNRLHLRFTIKQSRDLFDSVSLGLDVEEVGKANEEDLNANVHEVVLPSDCFESDGVDPLIERQCARSDYQLGLR